MTASLAVRSFHLPLDPPLETAAGTISERHGIAIRWRSSHTEGIGEATPLPGWTESIDSCRTYLTQIARSGSIPELGDIPPHQPATRHGIHLAQEDALAKEHGEPLAHYLATGSVQDRVPLAALIDASDSDNAARIAVERVESGHETLKCKVGASTIEQDIARLATIREAVGPDVTIRLDANRAWTPSQAHSALDAMHRLDIALIEEPVKNPTPESLAALRSHGIGIALDESVSREVPDAWWKAADAIVVKPMAIGGIDHAYRLAEKARKRNVEVIVSNTVDAVIARSAAVHLAAALHWSLPAGLDTASRLVTDLASDPIQRRHGALVIPDDPGIGTRGPWEEGEL